MRSRTAWVPVVLLGLGCLLELSSRAQRSMALREPLASLPRQVGDLRAVDLQYDSSMVRVAGVSDYLLRAYTRDSVAAFSLYVGYYADQRQGRTIHSPKNCLPGAGWEPMASSRPVLETAAGPIRVNRYLIAKDGQRALVYYWYQGRGRVEASEYKVKLDLLRDAALHRRSEEALVRFVVPVNGSEDSADRVAREAINTVIPELARVLPDA